MKTPCEPMGLLITASLDDELTDSEWTRLERHLAGCARCREQLREQEAAVLRLEGMDPADTERELWPDVEAALAAPPLAAPLLAASPLRRRPSLALSVLLAVALIVTKGVDLALFDSAGIGLRIGLLAAVAAGFVLARINPFRLASEQELAAAARAPAA